MGHCWAFGLCFTGDALVQVTALAGGMCEDGTSGLTVAIAVDGDGGTATLLDKSLALATHPSLCALPITAVPLGARVLAGNPRPEDFDTAFPEPDQATWVTLSLDLMKRDGTPVRAEFLRPREWVERKGIVADAVLLETALIKIGLDRSLADPEPLEALVRAVVQLSHLSEVDENVLPDAHDPHNGPSAPELH